MSILSFFGKVFGNKSTTTLSQATKEWPKKISVKLKKREPCEVTYESRWGYHPVSQETFLKLKELHKWYYETLKDLGCWVRWDRKTVYQHGPEPKYCPAFVEDRAEWRDHIDEQGNYSCRYYPKTRVDRGIREAYHEARMPKATPEEVEPLEISEEEIDHLHAEVSAWFDNN